jgi:hypothetical protein
LAHGGKDEPPRVAMSVGEHTSAPSYHLARPLPTEEVEPLLADPLLADQPVY